MINKDKILGKDIKLLSFPFSSAEEEKSKPGTPGFFEMETVSGEQNLCQAMAFRLLASPDALETLGHSHYGADILSFLGRDHSPHLEGQIKRALEKDPRIENISVQISKKYQDGHPILVLSISAYPVARLEAIHWNIEFKE